MQCHCVDESVSESVSATRLQASLRVSTSSNEVLRRCEVRFWNWKLPGCVQSSSALLVEKQGGNNNNLHCKTHIIVGNTALWRHVNVSFESAWLHVQMGSNSVTSSSWAEQQCFGCRCPLVSERAAGPEEWACPTRLPSLSPHSRFHGSLKTPCNTCTLTHALVCAHECSLTACLRPCTLKCTVGIVHTFCCGEANRDSLIGSFLATSRVVRHDWWIFYRGLCCVDGSRNLPELHLLPQTEVTHVC